jgi:hypothetical protein
LSTSHLAFPVRKLKAGSLFRSTKLSSHFILNLLPQEKETCSSTVPELQNCSHGARSWKIQHLFDESGELTLRISLYPISFLLSRLSRSRISASPPCHSLWAFASIGPPFAWTVHRTVPREKASMRHCAAVEMGPQNSLLPDQKSISLLEDAFVQSERLLRRVKQKQPPLFLLPRSALQGTRRLGGGSTMRGMIRP